MKKALVILMVLAMVFGAFADDLAAVTIKGDASLGYKIDLNDSTMGMTNGKSSSQEYTITLVTKDQAKSTEGSGVWGELVVKSSEAKIAQDGCANSAAASLATAKIHFGDMLAINVLCPDLTLGAKAPAFATGASINGVTAVGANPDDAAGFTAELALGFANINIKVADNGVKTTEAKKIGFAGDFDLKAVDGLTLWAGATYLDDFAAAANVAYELGLGETMTLTPMAAVTYAADLNWCAGVLLGWGANEQEPGFKFVADKCANGVSFAINKNNDIVIGAFDNTFVAGLAAGADYAANLDAIGEGVANVGVKYATDIDVFNVAAHGDFTMNLGNDTNDYKYGVTVTNSTFILNTDLSVGYEGGKDDKGVIEAKAKIHF